LVLRSLLQLRPNLFVFEDAPFQIAPLLSFGLGSHYPFSSIKMKRVFIFFGGDMFFKNNV
jgi:hypothetical protein